MFKTTRNANGEWQVKGLPFVIGKSPYDPKWGERQEWLICDATDPNRVLAGGYRSKSQALEKLTDIAQGLGLDVT